MTQTAEYKGRKYKLLWSGATKFGQKAKLGFWDGSKEFWADLNKVSIVARASSRRRGTWTGCSCGSVTEYSRPSDCWSCRHDAE